MFAEGFAMVLPLLLALCSPAVWADEPEPPSVGRSIQLLSRYGPGDLPASPAVLRALAALSDRGQQDVVPLLNSIAAEESSGLALLASAARDQVHARDQKTAQQGFRSLLPGRDAQVAWLDDTPPRTRHSSAGMLSRREGLAVAYAALLLGDAPPGGPRVLDLVEPEQSRGLVEQARTHERAHDFTTAALRYVQALGSGSSEGREGLTALGIDPETLLLGMTADTETGPAAVLPPTAMAALVAAPGRDAIAVLLSRAEEGRPLTRVVALSTLGQIAEASVLTPREHAAVRRALASATRSSEAFVREVALTALTGLPEP